MPASLLRRAVVTYRLLPSRLVDDFMPGHAYRLFNFRSPFSLLFDDFPSRSRIVRRGLPECETLPQEVTMKMAMLRYWLFDDL